MMKNKNIILFVVFVLVVGAFYFSNRKVDAPVVVAPDANIEKTEIEQKEICYFEQTVGGEFEGTVITDSAFTSVNYDVGARVYGIINWIPGEKDSLVGAYTGVVEASDVAGYPKRLNIIYAGAGEGIISRQQEILIVGERDIKTGIGEKVQDAEGVWKFKDTTKLVYENALPQVDCSTVPERLKTDYSKSN